MNRSKQLAGTLAVATAAILVCAYVLQVRTSGETAEAGPVDGRNVVEAPDDAEPLTQRVVATGPEIEPVGATPGPDPVKAAIGSLRLQVEAEPDGRPVPGLVIEILGAAGPDPWTPEVVVRADASGTVSVEALKVGSWQARSCIGGDVAFEIAAGSESFATLVVPDGPSLEGSVVDERMRPIAGAQVWISAFPDSFPEQPMSETAADGSFALPSIGRARCVCATAPGYAPSLVTTLPPSGPLEPARLVLPGRGGTVEGVVLDSDQHPVAGAVVSIGSGPGPGIVLVGMEIRRRAPPRTSRTDSRGGFAFVSVPAGTVPVTVRMPGYAPWSELVEVQPPRTTVNVVLEAGVTLTGTVRDGAGAAVAGAEVTVTASDGHERRTSSGPDGSFRVTDLPEHALRARAADKSGAECRATLEGVLGSELRWDPVLSEPVHVAGILLDPDGWRLEGWYVYASASIEGESWSSSSTTDAMGRFQIPCVSRDEHAIEVCSPSAPGHPRLTKTGVRPGSEELVLQLTLEDVFEGWLEGTLQAPDGAPLGGATVRAVRTGGNSLDGAFVPAQAEGRTDAAGRYFLGPLVSGTYSLWVGAEGVPPTLIARAKVMPSPTPIAMGTAKLSAAARVSLVFLRSDGSQPGRVSIQISDDAGAMFELAEHDVAGAGPRYDSPGLAPGRYVLRCAELVDGALLTLAPDIELEARSGESADIRVLLAKP